jgi:hypothetical protein
MDLRNILPTDVLFIDEHKCVALQAFPLAVGAFDTL